MMGGRAFILLKVGSNRPESSKQAEIRLAYLLKILPIRDFGRRVLSQNGKDGGWPDFCRTWIIRENARICYLDHSFAVKIGAVSCNGKQERGYQSIFNGLNTFDYILLLLYT
jgi:hypothetical protein